MHARDTCAIHSASALTLLIAWTSISAIGGCAVDTESVGSSSAEIVTLSDQHATYVYQRGGYGAYQYETDTDYLRAGGALLMPARQVVLGAVDDHPSYYGSKRRVQLLTVDVDSGSASFGSVINTWPLAYDQGSTALRGMAMSSYRDSGGNIDALALFVDWSPLSIKAIDLQGEAASPGPSAVQTVTGISSSLNAHIVPAVEFGRSGSTNKIFMAYAWRALSVHRIKVGFLTRGTGGSWTFTETDTIIPGGSGECADQANFGFAYNLSAAFDPDRDEFAVGWVCLNSTGWTAYMQRVDFWGVEFGPRLNVHKGVDAIHSGPQLSFNRVTDRYLFQFQHNTGLIRYSSTGLTCTRDSNGHCEDVLGIPITPAGIWDTEVDYWDAPASYSFREGGSCIGPGCTFGSGISGEYVSGSSASTPPDWDIEPGLLWSARPQGELSSVHNYIRAPEVGLTVVAHVWERPTNILGLLRYSFVDEPLGAFDE